MVKEKNIVDFGFITFDSEQVDEVVEKIGLVFSDKGYLRDGAKSVHCNCCDHLIRRRNLGNILPGSNIIYCDNPVCFAEYMDEHLGL